MTHPEELLADYVDGALDARARAEVDAHLASCGSCRADLLAARRAHTALRGVPQAEVPEDLRERVLAAARAEGSSPRRPETAPVSSLETARAKRRPPLAAWLAGVAAALVIGVFAYGGLGPSSDEGATPSSGVAGASAPNAEDGAAASGNPFVVQPNTNYDETGIERLAAAALTGTPAVAPSKAVESSSDAVASASRCLSKGAELTGDEQPVQLIEARFEGKPAYLGLYRIAASGEAPERGVVWVVAKRDCSVLSFSQRLPR